MNVSMISEAFDPAEGGVHLVGSIPLSDTEAVLRKCSDSLPNRLLRMPDGETGKRYYFMMHLLAAFKSVPQVLFTDPQATWYQPPWSGTAEDEDTKRALEELYPFQLEYDKAAIESYQVFLRLRDVEKIIPPRTRFQVSIANPTNMMSWAFKNEYRQMVEDIYMPSISHEINNIQTTIPKKDLAIQIDMAMDFAILEGMAHPWWDIEKVSTFQGIIDRTVYVAHMVHPDVELGFHLCYGDIEHKHFKQPKSTRLLVDVMLALKKQVRRPITWFHFPVPKDRYDDEYFAPLAELQDVRGDTMLYLGLVHEEDPEGTKRRIQTARKFVKGPFGVGTECGGGRTPAEALDELFEISANVTTPVLYP